MKGKLKGLSITETNNLLKHGRYDISNVFVGYRGSISHGMYRPSNEPNSLDDKDLLTVFIAGKEHYFGFGKRDVYETTLREWDVVSYELRKFIGLLLKCNPNVLSMLWLDESYVKYVTSYWRELIANREIFVSKAAYQSFGGYARSQFKRMTHLAYEGYMGEKRKKLVEKHGYDTKNASHLIRLLIMGMEFLSEGKLYVKRHDASYLLAIKDGEYSLEEIKREADNRFKLLEEAYLKSKLPEKPDREKAETLCMDLIEAYHYHD